MSDILRVNPYATSALQNESVDSLVEEFSELAIEREVNIAQLIAKTYLAVEQASHVKSHAKIDELEVHEKKLKTVTIFLSEIEARMTNPDAKEINLADKSALVEEMHKLCDHKLLEKTAWTRAEADTIRTALTRHSQIIMQQVQQASSAVNREIEQGTELLQIARKLLEMCDRLHQSFTSNQRGR